MGKHGKKKEETSKNPVIKALSPKKDIPKDRLSRDVEILDNGWNSTQEAEDFKDPKKRAEYRKKYHGGGKHS